MCFTGAVCYIKNDRRQNYRKKHQQRYKRTRARAYKRLVTTPLVLGHQRGGTITFTKPKNAQNNKEPEEKQTEATATVIQTKRQKREGTRAFQAAQVHRDVQHFFCAWASFLIRLPMIICG